MSFDGIVTRSVVHELKSKLINGRITKVYQPTNSEIILHFRSQGVNHKLLLSAHPTYSSFYLTDERRENPSHPPMFCMLLRKHMENGIIISVEQIGLERVVHLTYRMRNDLGDEVLRTLIIEIMGRHSNIILINPNTNVILDGIKRVSSSVSQYRNVLPGAIYKSPPEQGKINPLEVDKDSFLAGFDYNQGKLDKQMVHRFSGMSPLIAKEITHTTEIGSRENLWNTFSSVMNRIRNHDYQPVTIRNEKKFFYVYPLTHLQGEYTYFHSISACLNTFFHKKLETDQVQQQIQDLYKRITNEINKNEKKINVLTKELNEIEKSEKYRIYGELITANIHQINRGDDTLQTLNFYDQEQKEMTVPLDPLLTPSQNAQRYFKKYQKVKSSRKWNLEQIQKAKEDNLYLETILLQFKQSNLQGIEQIKKELQEEGWIKKKGTKKKKKESPPTPTSFYATDGTRILVGKNNKQNDYLTHRLASSSDTWLHAKEIPGSHVVIKGRAISEDTLLEGAMVAAYYSKAKSSSQVPVDFTLVKYVKKPSGARPGFVTYDHQQTIFVTPNEEKVINLLSQQAKS